MSKVQITVEYMQEMKALGESFAELMEQYRNTVANYPENKRHKLQISGIAKVRGMMKRTLLAAHEGLGGKFTAWQKEIDDLQSNSPPVERKKRAR